MFEHVRRPSREQWIQLGIFLIIVAVYAASLGNGPVWDDVPLVMDNQNLSSWQGLSRLFSSDLWSASAQGEPSSFYRPVTMLSFWLSVMLGGHSAASFRVGNVLIHALNAVLLMRLTRRMRASGKLAAAAVALIWGLAPICSEPVLWISGRFDLLVVTFALLALLGGRSKRASALPLTLAAVCAGMLSKESFIAWLPVLAVDDWLRPREDAPSRRSLVWKYGGVCCAVGGYFLVRWWLLLPSATIALQTGLRSLIESFFFLVATFLHGLLLPTSLDPFRPYAELSRVAFLFTGLLFGLLGGLVLSWHWRSRSHRALAALLGFIWFSCATLPSALVGPNLDMIGDRYAYLPLVGICLLATSVVGWLEPRIVGFARGAAWRRYALGSFVALLSGAETWKNVSHFDDWHDDAALARSSLRSSPGNAYALSSLGSMAARRGELAVADQLLTQSLARDARSWRTWNAMCYLRLHQNRLEEAERACREGLARHPENPRGWVNLASVSLRRNDFRAAFVAAQRAVTLKPNYREARYLAAVAAANLDQREEAVEQLRRGLALEPQNVKLRDLERQMQARGFMR
jgi:protein O-mannosyl-transferase